MAKFPLSNTQQAPQERQNDGDLSNIYGINKQNVIQCARFASVINMIFRRILQS